jgi:hypothetical protein
MPGAWGGLEVKGLTIMKEQKIFLLKQREA